MNLEPSSGLTIDIHTRFRKGCRDLPMSVRLEGNPMQAAVAARLLEQHHPHITVSDDGETVRLASLEQHASAWLASFLTDEEPPSGRYLLHTVPEDVLVAYAERQGIPVMREEKSDVRLMLERIAAEQPQTFFSLAKGMERLSERI